jgi:hypothetical protein
MEVTSRITLVINLNYFHEYDKLNENTVKTSLPTKLFAFLISVGSCVHDNEHSGFQKYWEILEYLSDWWLVKRTQLHGVNYLIC